MYVGPSSGNIIIHIPCPTDACVSCKSLWWSLPLQWWHQSSRSSAKQLPFCILTTGGRLLGTQFTVQAKPCVSFKEYKAFYDWMRLRGRVVTSQSPPCLPRECLVFNQKITRYCLGSNVWVTPMSTMQKNSHFILDTEDGCYHCGGGEYCSDLQLTQGLVRHEIYVLIMVQAGLVQLCYKSNF